MSQKNTRRLFASQVLFVSLIISIIISFALFVFIVVYLSIFSELENNIGVLVFASLCFVGGPILLFFTIARRFCSVIQMDEDGISRSVFGKFCKLSMKWDEIYEISYFESGMAFLLFSKKRSVQGMSYWKITGIKDLIQIQLTQKNYDFVKQYIQQPIIGLTDAKMSQLKLKK